MQSNFSFRDFIVYFLTGMNTIICLGIVFFEKLPNAINIIKSMSFSDISEGIIWIVVAYTIGHLTCIIYALLNKIYVLFYKKIKNKSFLNIMMLFVTFRRCTVVYAVDCFCLKNKTQKEFNNSTEFWKLCCNLQKEKIYPDYTYVISEFLQHLSFVCLCSAILSVCVCNYSRAIIFMVIGIVTYWRAKQFSDYFVQTICNICCSVKGKTFIF
jgi:hypothetical protein